MIDTKRPLRVFLCHASGDKPAVRKLYDLLVKDGIDAWLDERKLIPGQQWQIEIPKAVKYSDVVIVCLSSQSVTKEGFVQKEIRLALDAADEKPDDTIFIIPARLENCEVPERIKKFHWVDLFSDGGNERLLQALQIRAGNLGIEVGGTPLVQAKDVSRNIIQTFYNVWYRFDEWSGREIPVFKDSGRLTVYSNSLEFLGKETVVIEHCKRISFGKQGKDFVNNWVKVEYGNDSMPQTAFFADGNWMGYGGVFGGAKKIFTALQHLAK